MCFMGWIGCINASLYLIINFSPVYTVFFGILLLAITILTPIVFFWHNIVMFFKNMKGVFTYEDGDRNEDSK